MQLEHLTEVLGRYRKQRTEGKVVDYKDYRQLEETFAKLDLNPGSRDWDQLWKMVDAYLENSVKTAHPQYFNQLWAGQSDPAFIGSVIEVLANTSMYTYEVAPMATLVEKKMLAFFQKKFGFHNGESQVTTGGSNSNYIALMLALHQKFPFVKSEGLHSIPPVAVFVSEESHYSLDKAAVMLGLGTDTIQRVAVDESGAIEMSALERSINEAKAADRIPIAIVGTAGTTIRGAYDPFKEISKIAKQEECWFHIDGAWGGAAIFASAEKRFLEGRQFADSMAWDAHKMLGIPLMCAMLFVREKGHFDKVCNLGDTSYIFHEGAESQDLGPYSLQCGRRVDMLKCWLEYLYYGEEGFQQRVNRFMQLSQLAEDLINEDEHLELQTQRWINNICFRSTNESVKDLDGFNRAIRDELHQSGKSFVNVAYINGELTIRLIITNQFTTEEDIRTFFDLWKSTTQSLLPKFTQDYALFSK